MEKIKIELSLQIAPKTLKNLLKTPFRVEFDDETGIITGTCNLLDDGKVIVFTNVGTIYQLSPTEIGYLLEKDQNKCHRWTRV
jgi:hypothetical protein